MAGSQELVPRFDPALLQPRWVLGGLSPEELVAQALSALMQDFTGNALQQLAGLVRPTLADLETLPERAFAELGLKAIDRDQAIALLIARGEPTSSDTVKSLVKAFPSFSVRWMEHIAWWGGKQAGSYNDMAVFVHFVVEDLYEKGDLEEVRRVFSLMESSLVGSDEDTRNLIGLGFFETLQNVASHRPYGYTEFEQFLGPTSMKIWREIQRMWAGKSNLADVIRAERERA
jgi:hypothetical protein